MGAFIGEVGGCRKPADVHHDPTQTMTNRDQTSFVFKIFEGDVFAQIVGGIALTEVPSSSICPVTEDTNAHPGFRGIVGHHIGPAGSVWMVSGPFLHPTESRGRAGGTS